MPKSEVDESAGASQGRPRRHLYEPGPDSIAARVVQRNSQRNLDMSGWSADRKHGSGRPGGNRFNSNDWNKRKRQNFSNPSRQVGSYAGKGRSTAYFSGPLRYQQNRRGSQFDDDRRFYGQPGRRNFWYGNDRKFFEDDEGSRFSPLRNDYRKQRNTNREFFQRFEKFF